MTKEIFLLTLIIFLSLLLKLYNLNFPQEYYFDENYTVFTAVKLATADNKQIWIPQEKPIDPPMGYEWQHPPLTRILISASIILLGNKPWVWRLPSVIAGTLTILLIFLIGNKYFNKKVGLLAAYFLAFDGLSFAQSRIATRDSLLVFIILASLYLTLQHKHFLSIIVAGFALATKWSAIFLLPLLLINALVYKKMDKNKKVLFLLLTVIPFLTYISTYLAYFSAGFNFLDFLELQKTIVAHMQNHALTITTIHPYHSPWWQWPLGYKPILHYLDGSKQIWAMPNFISFWLGLMAVTFTILNLLKSKHSQNSTRKSLFCVLTGYFIFLLPWIIIYLLNSGSSASYLHYYLPSLPFLHLLTAYWIHLFFTSKKRYTHTMVFGILIIIPIIFLCIYPRLVGL